MSLYPYKKFVRQDSFSAITGTPQSSTAIGVGDANALELLVKFTYVAGSAVVITFDVSRDASTWYQLTSVAVAAGTGTRVLYTDSTATGSANKNFTVSLPRNISDQLLLAEYIRYNIAATSGSTDSATVDVYTGYTV